MTAHSAFPVTRHSLIQRLGATDAAENGRADTTRDSLTDRRAAYDAVCAAYRQPVCRYLERQWRLQPQDAEDATQQFFARAWDEGFLAQFDAKKARFRTFLRVCLDRQMQNMRRHDAAARRGGDGRGGVHHHASLEEAVHASDGDTPDTRFESAFREEFVRALFARAVSRLQQEMAARGRSIVFEVFRRYDLEPEGVVRYAAIADALGLPVTQVTNHLHAARRRFRELTLDELRDLCATDAEFRDEARDLLGVRHDA